MQLFICCGIIACAFTSLPSPPNPIYLFVQDQISHSICLCLNIRPVSGAWSLSLFCLASFLPFLSHCILSHYVSLFSCLFQLLVSQVAVVVVLGVVMLTGVPGTQMLLDTLF